MDRLKKQADSKRLWKKLTKQEQNPKRDVGFIPYAGGSIRLEFESEGVLFDVRERLVIDDLHISSPTQNIDARERLVIDTEAKPEVEYDWKVIKRRHQRENRKINRKLRRRVFDFQSLYPNY
jgi:hypothetical protein